MKYLLETNVCIKFINDDSGPVETSMFTRAPLVERSRNWNVTTGLVLPVL